MDRAIKTRKNNGIVLKYYTVICWDNRKEYTSHFKNFIKLFNDFLAQESICMIDKFELNYATKKYSLEDVNTKEEIVDAIGNNAADSVSVIYGNNALNKLKKESEKELIDLIIHFKEEVSEEFVLKLTDLVNNIFSITYGYGFYLEKNQEIISESFLKKTLFGVSVKSNTFKIDTSIEMGNIPKIYKYNFLNREQIQNNNILNWKPLSTDLFYYKID